MTSFIFGIFGWKVKTSSILLKFCIGGKNRDANYGKELILTTNNSFRLKPAVSY